MLTIKLIEPGGAEQIREVTSVWTSPHDPIIKVLARPAEGGETLQFSGPGMLYVSNAMGETIARYDLGAERNPVMVKRGVPRTSEGYAAAKTAPPV